MNNVIFVMLMTMPIVAFASNYSAGFYFGTSDGVYQYDGVDTKSGRGDHYGFVGSYQASRNTRWGFCIESMDSAGFSAETSGIGLAAERTLIGGSLERRFVVSELFKPYLGLGLIYSQNDFENVFTVDNGGFFTGPLADDQQSDISAQLLVSQYFEVTEKISLGLRGRYELGHESFTGFSLSGEVLYGF